MSLVLDWLHALRPHVCMCSHVGEDLEKKKKKLFRNLKYNAHIVWQGCPILFLEGNWACPNTPTTKKVNTQDFMFSNSRSPKLQDFEENA